LGEFLFAGLAAGQVQAGDPFGALAALDGRLDAVKSTRGGERAYLRNIQPRAGIGVLEHLNAEFLRLVGEFRLAELAATEVERMSPEGLLGFLLLGKSVGSGGKRQEGKHESAGNLEKPANSSRHEKPRK